MKLRFGGPHEKIFPPRFFSSRPDVLRGRGPSDRSTLADGPPSGGSGVPRPVPTGFGPPPPPGGRATGPPEEIQRLSQGFTSATRDVRVRPFFCDGTFNKRVLFEGHVGAGGGPVGALGCHGGGPSRSPRPPPPWPALARPSPPPPAVPPSLRPAGARLPHRETGRAGRRTGARGRPHPSLAVFARPAPSRPAPSRPARRGGLSRPLPVRPARDRDAPRSGLTGFSPPPRLSPPRPPPAPFVPLRALAVGGAGGGAGTASQGAGRAAPGPEGLGAWGVRRPGCRRPRAPHPSSAGGGRGRRRGDPGARRVEPGGARRRARAEGAEPAEPSLPIESRPDVAGAGTGGRAAPGAGPRRGRRAAPSQPRVDRPDGRRGPVTRVHAPAPVLGRA